MRLIEPIQGYRRLIMASMKATNMMMKQARALRIITSCGAYIIWSGDSESNFFGKYIATLCHLLRAKDFPPIEYKRFIKQKIY